MAEINKDLRFGPLERIISYRFPKPLKVYWVWATSGKNFKDAFPGPNTWEEEFADPVTGIPFRIRFPAPWMSHQNIFHGSRNPIKPHSLATFCGITVPQGKYKPPTMVPFHQETWDGPTINETGSEIIGGFFLVKEEAILYATNLFNKGHFFGDWAARHSWPYNWGAVAVPVPAIFYTTDLGNAPTGSPIKFICDNIALNGVGTKDGKAAYYAYLTPPKSSFNVLEIWETTWPTGGTGPTNAATPPLKLTVDKVSKGNPFSPLADTSGAPGTFQYAIFEGGTHGSDGFQNYRNPNDPSLGFTGTQISDYFATEAEAIEAKDNLLELANKKERLFFPADHFKSDFKLEPKLIAKITYDAGVAAKAGDPGRAASYKIATSSNPNPTPIQTNALKDKSSIPPTERHVCTNNASLSPVGGFAVVFDSCGNRVGTNLGLGRGEAGSGGIDGTINLGLNGPYDFDYTGLKKP